MNRRRKEDSAKDDPDAYGKAILNVLEDFGEEKAHLQDTQRAILNILDDAQSESARLNDSRRALLNILEDAEDERAWLKATQRSVLNILEDVDREMRERQRAEGALRESEEKFRSISASAQDAILMMDNEGRVSYWNAAAENIFGYTQAEALGRDLHALLTPGRFHTAARKGFQHFRNTGMGPVVGQTVELIARRKSGEEFPVEVSLSAVLLENRWNAIGILRDISERKRAEAEQNLAKEKLQQAAKVFQSTSEGVAITNAQGEIISVNRAFEVITGYTADEVIGRTPRILKSGRHDEAFYQSLWEQLRQDGHWQGEIWNRRKSGTIYPEWLSISSIRDSAGNVQNFIAVFSDISSLKNSEARIRDLAYFDPLTRLPNRQLLSDRLWQALTMAERSGTRLALAFLDLDRFKNINDSLGHSVGDELLVQVAARLLGCLRESDTIARLGGDEFLVILPQISGLHYITYVIDKIRRAVSEVYLIGERELHITTSIGIAVYPENGQDPETLIRNADAAMYQAKAAGRNDFQFYTEELNVRATEQLLIENSLRRALERDEFILHYQPQIELKSRRLIGAEALIRWQHPDLGLIYPGKFIHSAEISGQIIDIGEWVLAASCRELKKYQGLGIALPRLAVNLSVVQFRQRNFLDRIIQVVEEAGVSPQCLELELTESILMENSETNIGVLRKLKDYGFFMSVDDFGTGYSSLSYLKRLPIDKLKIDQGFVRDCIHDENDAAIIRAIISLSLSLGLQVIAEGVETAEQMKFLAELGCHEGQGYLIGRPGEAEELIKFLSSSDPGLTSELAAESFKTSLPE